MLMGFGQTVHGFRYTTFLLRLTDLRHSLTPIGTPSAIHVPSINTGCRMGGVWVVSKVTLALICARVHTLIVARIALTDRCHLCPAARRECPQGRDEYETESVPEYSRLKGAPDGFDG